MSNLLHNEKENNSCLFSSLFLAKFAPSNDCTCQFIQYNQVNCRLDVHLASILYSPPVNSIIRISPPPSTFHSNLSLFSLSLRQRRIILLSMLTPPLTRDMLIRCNWSTFLLGTNFENYRGNKTHGKGTNGRIAFPCYGCWPPSSCGGPYLKYRERCFGGIESEYLS